jgi:hypothetical protein
MPDPYADDSEDAHEADTLIAAVPFADLGFRFTKIVRLDDAISLHSMLASFHGL